MTTEVRTQPFRLYRMWDADGRLLYIGQTGRMPLKRCIEHLMEQAWGPDVARWELDPGTWWSEADVLAAELAAIRAEKPIRNWVGNEGPHRQWLPKVTEYRHPSSWPARTPTVAAPSAWPSAHRALTSPWTWWAVAWTVAVAVIWVVLGKLAVGVDMPVPPLWRFGLATLGAGAGVGRLWWWASGRRWARRTKRRMSR